MLKNKKAGSHLPAGQAGKLEDRSSLLLTSVFGLLTFSLFTFHFSLAQHYQLVWSDEFDGDKLNLNNWSYEYGNGVNGWGTGQMDYCTDREKNVKVSNGTLKLTLHYESYKGYNYTSGRINSHNKVAFKYGKIEARVRVPAGRGIGAAFWMLPERSDLGGWPDSGEIDIVETNGDELERNYGTVHFKQWGIHQHNGNPVHIPGDISKDFHTYWIEWDENAIRWFVDGRQFHEFNIRESIDGRMVFHDPFYIILSTGVGSQFSGSIIDDELLPQSMEFDYVRVYQKVFTPEPEFVKTNGKGTEVEVKFSEPMSPPSADHASLFSMKSDKGRIINFVSVSTQYRDNTVYILKPESPVQKDERVSLTYRGGKVTGANKQMLSSFENFPVANIVMGASPSVYSAETSDYYQLYLRFSKSLLIPDTFSGRQFTLLSNGKPNRIINAIADKNLSGLLLYTEWPLLKGDSLLLSYSDTLLKARDGLLLTSFENMPVKNTLEALPKLPGKIEAEDYTEAFGVRTQDTGDEGGGKNIGYIEDLDWLEYKVYVPEAGKYKFAFRIASQKGNGFLEVFQQERSLGITHIPSTADWQKWITVESGEYELESGVSTIKLFAKMGGFNINWFEVLKIR